MEADRDDGALMLPSKTRLGPYLLDQWLPAKRASLRPSTFESYQRNVARHVVPHLGHVPLQALSPDRLNAWYGELLERGQGPGRGLSVATTRYLHTILGKALGDAVRWGLVARNVAAAADPPKASAGRRREMQTWTAEQVGAFLAQVRGDRLEAAFVLAVTPACAGARCWGCAGSTSTSSGLSSPCARASSAWRTSSSSRRPRRPGASE